MRVCHVILSLSKDLYITQYKILRQAQDDNTIRKYTFDASTSFINMLQSVRNKLSRRYNRDFNRIVLFQWPIQV